MGKPKLENDDEKGWPRNLYKRGESWILDFYFRGERYTETLGPMSKTAAQEKRDKRKGDVAAGELAVNGKLWKNKQWIPEIQDAPPVEDPLFETALEKFMAWYKANRGAYTYLKYATPASKALEASFKGKHLSEISPFSIEAHKLDRKRGPDAEHPDRKAVKDGTIQHDLTFLRHMFNKCIEWNLAAVNPMDKVELFKLNNGRDRHLSTEEANRLLSVCGLELRVVVLTACHTGFRKKELQSLKWQAINLARNSISVESCYSKNGDARTLPLSPDLADALRRLKNEHKPAPDDLVFIYEGRPWKTWRRSFRTALKKAGIKDFRFHDLRHCFGSWLAMNNVPDKGRMELMGHKDPKMTARYTHLSPGYKQQAINDLPRLGTESQQISQQAETANVVNFGR